MCIRDSLFGGDHDLAEFFLHAGAPDAVLERALHRLLEAGIGVNHVPALAHSFFQPSIKSYSRYSSVLSLTHRNTAMTRTNANTIPAVCSDSLRDGHTTFFTSVIASRRNARNCCPDAVNHATATPAPAPAAMAAKRTIAALSPR